MREAKGIHTTGGDVSLAELVADKARDAAKAQGVRDQVYKAISVQRPVVLDYLRSLRRDKPNASAVELLRELDRRYVAVVTTTSTGVGASAAIPGVGVPVALTLGVADLLFFYETSALYVLAVAELHGIAVNDDQRAKPLVFGMLLGEKSQSQVTKLVLGAIPGAAGVDEARNLAAGVVGKAMPDGWGEVLTEQLPDSALAPLLTVLARQALKESAKLGAGTLGKALPFGVGAIVGGVGSFTFGRDVVRAAHIAFPVPPVDLPATLADDEILPPGAAPTTRAAAALKAAAGGLGHLGEDAWDAASRVGDLFRSVDLDGDGIPDEARALTAVKAAGSAVRGATVGAAGAVLHRRRATSTPEADPSDGNQAHV